MKQYVDIPISWGELRRLAVFHRKLDIVAKLDKLNPADYDLLFSDGCSMWPDEWKECGYDLSTPCFWHDGRYFLGGTWQERLQADKELFADVLAVAGMDMALTMFAGVRAGGWVPGTGFEWGYGKINAAERA
jgi:hypothetical protein